MPAPTFADWLGAHMDRRGIRSGRRLAAETGLDELAVLDWAIGRRVPSPHEVGILAQFFNTAIDDALALRDRSEASLPRRGRASSEQRRI